MAIGSKDSESMDLTALCGAVRDLIGQNHLRESEELIKRAMCVYPHAPEPHNLMGIQLEKEGNHLAAMKHFRAAWALDPTYLPARFNMSQYADLFRKDRVDAYIEDDCPREPEENLYQVEYSENGFGRIVKKTGISRILSSKQLKIDDLAE